MYLFISTTGVAFSADPDVEGSKDHPMFNRLPGYRIQRYEEKEFDTLSFRDAKLNEIKLEGHVTKIRYAPNQELRSPAGPKSCAITKTPSRRSAELFSRAITTGTHI